MVVIFQGDDEATHNLFQDWRRRYPDGFHLTETSSGKFTIHYTQDLRDNSDGRGCNHQGGSHNGIEVDGCYTKKRKVCSERLEELVDWATRNGFTTRNCSHCDSQKFPFPVISDARLQLLPDESQVPGTFPEGNRCRVEVNAYERNPKARAACLDYYKCVCSVCEMNFETVYGPEAKGFIHVHHLEPLSKNGTERQVDPVADLRPVCPNCHAVIHLDGQCRSIESVRAMLRRNSKP